MTDKDGDVTMNCNPFGDGINDGNHEDHDLISDNVDEEEQSGDETPVGDEAPVRDAVRDSLFSDPYILDTANSFRIEGNQIVTRNHKSCLVFCLKARYFEGWKARHQISVSTDFSPHKEPRAHTTQLTGCSSQGKEERADQIETRYDCHRRGE
ncbi:hypothetical protein BGZ54_009905, partial [Gamsiella multidivaricata]